MLRWFKACAIAAGLVVVGLCLMVVFNKETVHSARAASGRTYDITKDLIMPGGRYVIAFDASRLSRADIASACDEVAGIVTQDPRSATLKTVGVEAEGGFRIGPFRLGNSSGFVYENRSGTWAPASAEAIREHLLALKKAEH